MHVNIVSEFCLSRWSGLNYLNSGTKASSGKYCEVSTSMAEYSCSIVNSVPPPATANYKTPVPFVAEIRGTRTESQTHFGGD